jgi:DNA-binding beta-propeller fold protein YncE
MSTSILTSMLLTVVVTLPIACLQGAEPLSDATAYRVLTTHLLGGDGGWDLLTSDAPAHRLYIARANRVMVVDTEKGKLFGEIAGAGLHGVAVVPETNRGFFTNGKENSVTIFDLKTLAVVGHAKAGIKPDAIIYDAASNQIFVANNGGTDVTVLSPIDGHVVTTIDVGGNPELLAVDGNGHLYTNLEDKDAVGVVDTVAKKALASWPLAPGKSPTGIAVDPEHHRVFSACRGTKTLEVTDTESGKIIASPAIGSGADGAVFDPLSGNVLIPNGEGTLTVIHEDSPTIFRVTQTLATSAGARTIALDAVTHNVYLVTADQKPATSPGSEPKGRPEYLPGTFKLLIVGR